MGEDPVAVVDFQSLYPSVMISYNLCFSTIVGRVLPNPNFRINGCPIVEGKFDPNAKTCGSLGIIPYPQIQTYLTAVKMQTAKETSDDGNDGTKEENKGF